MSPLLCCCASTQAWSGAILMEESSDGTTSENALPDQSTSFRASFGANHQEGCQDGIRSQTCVPQFMLCKTMLTAPGARSTVTPLISISAVRGGAPEPDRPHL